MKTVAAITCLVKVAVLAVLAGFVTPLAANGVKAPTSSKVSLGIALADAHRLASKPGDRVLRVKGASMLPYFGDGAVLVVRAAALESLKPGMVVLYRNRFDEMVAHRVEARVGAAWTVRGANNDKADSTLVTAENLLGAVYVTLYADAGGVADGASLAGVAAEATPVALAAAAR
jgi:signal peptidase I